MAELRAESAKASSESDEALAEASRERDIALSENAAKICEIKRVQAEVTVLDGERAEVLLRCQIFLT